MGEWLKGFNAGMGIRPIPIEIKSKSAWEQMRDHKNMAFIFEHLPCPDQCGLEGYYTTDECNNTEGVTPDKCYRCWTIPREDK